MHGDWNDGAGGEVSQGASKTRTTGWRPRRAASVEDGLLPGDQACRLRSTDPKLAATFPSAGRKPEPLGGVSHERQGGGHEPTTH
jgi:hypothetical protein